MTNNKKLELYFHIPFCVRKCLYCDFLSAPANDVTQDAYMDALFAEVQGRAEEFRDYEVTSVFIGGGTPSVLSAAKMQKLLFLAKRSFHFIENAEITIEVNPGTVDEEKLFTYKNAGINRLSIGLQSADDEALKRLGRIHTYEQFLDTFTGARKAGFTNVNVDIMSALPGQTLLSYREGLEKVLSLPNPPEHISAYSLIVEEGTPFAEMAERGELPLPDEDCEREMYAQTEQILKQYSYHRYEISNYAKPGCECRHNCGYWNRTEYLGFGVGAASLIENVRFHNGSDLRQYMEHPLDYREDVQELSKEEQVEEFMFLGLRMTKGVSVTAFQKQFEASMEEIYGTVIQRNIEDELLFYYKDAETKEEYLALTRKGLDLSNYCMAQFLLT